MDLLGSPFRVGGVELRNRVVSPPMERNYGTPDGAVTDRYVAYSDRPAENIIVVDPAAEQEILPINVHGSPTGLAWDGTRIWYCDNAHSRLRAIDVPGIVRTA